MKVFVACCLCLKVVPAGLHADWKHTKRGDFVCEACAAAHERLVDRIESRKVKWGRS